MQVDQLAAFPALQPFLQDVDAQLELGPRAADPQEVGGRQGVGQAVELGEVINAEVKDAHRDCGRHARKRRAASSAK
jgi:hypothetical protein